MKVQLQNKIHVAGPQTYTQTYRGRRIVRRVPLCGQRSSKLHPAEAHPDARVTCLKCIAAEGKEDR